MTDTITIDGINIGPCHPPYIIAELSGNHNQSIERAFALIDSAKEQGAHAIKLQTYTADTMTIPSTKPGFLIEDPNSLWYGRSLHDLYEEAHTPWEWHRELFSYAKQKGITIFSSPFDKTAVDFLEELGAPCYKVASFECTDLPLVRYIAATGKPMIVSTGMATAAEIDATVRAIREAGCENFVLLKCTSTYPSTPENTNISTIPHMRTLFNCQVGVSDHTLGCGVSVAAVALGATVVEKHFTLDREDGGVDSVFSMEPQELNDLVVNTKAAWQSIGKVHYGPYGEEKKSLSYRRSIYVVKDVKKGESLNESNLRVIRPGFGLPPKEIDKLLGCSVSKDIEAGTPMSWDLIKQG